MTGPDLTFSGDGNAFVMKIDPTATSSPLVATLTPVSRAVQVGTFATTRATIRNTGTGPAVAVGITLLAGVDAGLVGPFAFVYQTVDALGQLTGTPNTPVTIPPGGLQDFVLGVLPVGQAAAVPLVFVFDGTNTLPAPTVRGGNTLLLSATDDQPPDLIAIVATCASDDTQGQVFNLPELTTFWPTAAFAVAALNIGAAGQITALPTTGDLDLPVALSICQTDSQTGQCLQLPPTTSVSLQMEKGATATFAVFVQNRGQIGFDPARRVFVEFRDETDQTLGEVSVPVRTHSPACAS